MRMKIVTALLCFRLLLLAIMMVMMAWLWECPSVSWGVRGLPWVTDLFLQLANLLAWWYEWRVECERVNRAAMAPAFNGQSSGRFTIWLSGRSLAVVHNLFSSIESLHLPPSMFLLLKTIRRVSCASFNCGTGAEHKYSYSMPPPCLLGALFTCSGWAGGLCLRNEVGGISRGLLPSLDFWPLFR